MVARDSTMVARDIAMVARDRTMVAGDPHDIKRRTSAITRSGARGYRTFLLHYSNQACLLKLCNRDGYLVRITDSHGNMRWGSPVGALV